jgi:hypothetical protein
MVETVKPTSAGRSTSADIVGTLKTLMIAHSLPLWSAEGWDRTSGGFVERLDQEGGPIALRLGGFEFRLGRSTASPKPLKSAGIPMAERSR